MRWMNLEPIIQSGGSQKEKYHVLPHIYGERWYWGTYLQGNNGDADLWTRAAVEEGEGGTNGETNMEAYTLPCVKQIANGN